MRFANDLRSFGISLWIDRDSLAPGQRWQDVIRNAIREGSYFIACFSTNYTKRDRSYMNEELTLAIEQLRQYPTERTWFIPVLIDDCEIPDRSISACETLKSLQFAALFRNWDREVAKIVSVIDSDAKVVPSPSTDQSAGYYAIQKIGQLKQETKNLSRIISPQTGPGSLSLIFGGEGDRYEFQFKQCLQLRREIFNDLEKIFDKDSELDTLSDLEISIFSKVEKSKAPNAIVAALLGDINMLESMLKSKLMLDQLESTNNPDQFICPGCGRSSNAKNGSLCSTCNQFVHHNCASKSFVHWFCPVCGSQLVGQ
jgi:TIR domain